MTSEDVDTIDNDIPRVVYEREVDEFGKSYATGKRKSAVARVWVFPGTGKVSVNKKSLIEYFGDPFVRYAVVEPFECIKRINQFDVYATVRGGGFTGQSQAIKLGIAKALIKQSPDYRPRLKSRMVVIMWKIVCVCVEGYLTVDTRRVERKKTGRRKARASFPLVKR